MSTINIPIDISKLSIGTRLWLTKATSEEILNIIEIGYKLSIQNNDKNNILLELDIIKDLINNKQVNEQKTSVEIGQFGETYVFEILQKYFPTVVDFHDKAHSGDYVIDDILVEVKNYKTTIPKKEIDKFHKDLNNLKAGILISLNTPFVHMKKYNKTIYKNKDKHYHVIYINTNDENTIYMAINLLQLELKIENKKIDDVKIEIIKNRIIKMENILNEIIVMKNNLIEFEKSNIDYICNLKKSITLMENILSDNLLIVNSEI